MSKNIGELSIKLTVDSKTGEVKIKNFGEVIDKTVTHSQTKLSSLKSSFTKVGEFGQKLFFTIQGFKALAAPLGEMVRLANEQETAEANVASALQQVDLYSKANIEQLKKQATAIQGVTTVGDEQVLMLQTMALNMGIQFGKIDEVTRGSIGLAQAFGKAGLSQETAMKGVALAYQGNFEQLQRYIPALRSAKDNTEKMSILQEAMAGGFKQSTDLAKTGAGQMQQYANLVGDLKEKLGELIKKAILPLIAVGKPLVTWFNDLKPSTVNFMGVAGALTIVLWKVVPAIRGISGATRLLGVSIKGALGWIGLIITAATLLYTAWATNLGGFQEKLKVAWEYVKSWGKTLWVLIKGYVAQWVNAFNGLADIIMSVFTLDWDGVTKGADKMRAALGNGMEKTSKEIEGIWQKHGENVVAIHEGFLEKEAETNAKKVENHAQTEKEKTAETKRQAEERRKKELEEAQVLRDLQIGNMGDEFDQKRAKLDDWYAAQQEKYAGNREILKELKISYDAQIDEIDTARDEAKAEKELTEAEAQAEKDALALEEAQAKQDYEFEQGRVSTDEYIAQLNLRLAAMKKAGKSESLEYKKLNDYKNRLGKQELKNRLSDMAGLMGAFKGHSRALFNIGKGASIAQAVIDTIASSVKAFKNAGGFPWGVVPAATSLAMGYAKVAQIKAQKFAKGGLIDRPTFGLIGEAGQPELIAPKSNFIDVVNNLKNEGAFGNGERGKKVEDNISKLGQGQKLITKKLSRNAKKTKSLAEVLARVVIGHKNLKDKLNHTKYRAPLGSRHKLPLSFDAPGYMFADGGVVNKPTLGLLGEAGQPELIAPKSNFIDVVKQMQAKGAFGGGVHFGELIASAIDRIGNKISAAFERVSSFGAGVDPVQFAGAGFGGSAPAPVENTPDNTLLTSILLDVKELLSDLSLAALDDESLALKVESGQKRIDIRTV